MAAGDNTTRGTTPANGQDASDRGLTGQGQPASRPSASRPARKSSGGGGIEALVKAMDEVGLSDQHDLNEFCEAGRKLSHYLAVQSALAAGELTSGARDMAKLGHQWAAAWKMKRVTKHLEASADHFASAASGFVSAWSTFEQVYADILEKSETKAKSHQRFTIK
jgi:hypothetical protein